MYSRYIGEIRTLLNSRKIDKYKPKLVTNIFYLEIDERVKTEYLRGEEQKREEELRQLALYFNYAEFYLSGRDSSSAQTVEAAKAKCLNDLKTVWKKRVEHFEVKLAQIRRELDELRQKDLRKSEIVLSNRERREPLEYERELVQRVLGPYKQRDMFREKCLRVEQSFDAYVKTVSLHKESEWAKIKRTVKTEAN